MAIHLTRIYTKVGDDGTTAIGDGSRVPKTDPRIRAYADTDETNAVIGTAIALGALPDPLPALLRRVQNDLFDVGADLAVPTGGSGDADRLRVDESYVGRLEVACDTHNEHLAPLDSFVLPGGSPGAALLHQARTVARRAERSTWHLLDADPEHTSAVCARYLNRLSDLLFILARVAAAGADVRWQPGGPAASQAHPEG